MAQHEVLICSGATCIAAKGNIIKTKLEAEIAALQLQDIEVKFTGCRNFCQRGPVIIIEPEGTCYLEVKPGDVAEIVKSHFKDNKPVERLLYKDPVSAQVIPNPKDLMLHLKQRRSSKDLGEFLKFAQKESCGKCAPCRLGTKQMLDIYTGVKTGKRPKEDLAIIEEICNTMKKTSLCNFGKTTAIAIMKAITVR